MNPMEVKPKTQNGNSYYWQNLASRESFFIEKFGHTQIWIIYDGVGLEEIQNHLPIKSPKN